MTVSGSVDYNPARDTILKRALRMVGGYSAEGDPSAAQLVDAATVLDIMLKEWIQDKFLFLRQTATLFLNEGQTVYTLGNTSQTGFSHCATSYVQTNVKTASLASAGSVELDSITGMTNAGFIGIEDDDGDIEWFYGTFSGTTATLFSDVACSSADTMDAAAAVGNVAYYHSVASQIQRPTELFSASRKAYNSTAANGTDTPVQIVSRSDYLSYSAKTTTGKIVSVYYDPQMDAGKLYVWPTADSCQDKLVLDVSRPMSDMDASTDTFDLPVESLSAVVDNLALELEPEYPLSANAYQKLRERAMRKKDRLMASNRDMTPITFCLERY
jgi:hypothetical protein